MPVIDPQAVRELEDARKAMHESWSREGLEKWNAALDRVWNPFFCDAYRRFRKGDFSVVGTIIEFLEEDPVFFRSGYVKELFLQKLHPKQLSKKQVSRLRKVCLKAVDTCSRREFRRYCRLASRIADDDMVQELYSRYRIGSGAAKSRTRMMINSIATHGKSGLAHAIPERNIFLELLAATVRKPKG